DRRARDRERRPARRGLVPEDQARRSCAARRLARRERVRATHQLDPAISVSIRHCVFRGSRLEVNRDNRGTAAAGAHVFADRHIGPREDDLRAMLEVLGVASLDALVDATLPPAIRARTPLALPPGVDEPQMLAELRALAASNELLKSFIGLGYYGTHTPPVIQRNVLENPGWYTAYTPYQPEISQGRLEALFTFQTMVADLTGLPVANASLLDEATAAAEAMTLCRRMSKSTSKRFFVADDCLPQTIEVLRTRARPLGYELVIGNASRDAAELECFGALFQYPGANGEVRDLRETITALRGRGALVAVAADLLALTVLVPPGELGADVAVGSAQRFGVPLGFGGPHAAYMAVREALTRSLPGRLVGLSIEIGRAHV